MACLNPSDEAAVHGAPRDDPPSLRVVEPMSRQASGEPPGSRPKISAVLCTYNRAALLTDAIQSLVDQTLPWSDYEIVIVDNASTDPTPRVVHELAARYPALRLRLIREPQQGLCHARNTGYHQAGAEIVAFVDDDVIVNRDWLRSILECFETIEPPPWGVGGPAFPSYDAAKPAWFKDEYETDTWGLGSRFLTPGESFSGNNMAFRVAMLDRYGGFDANLDMTGGRLRLGGDTEFFMRAWRFGGTAACFYYCHRAAQRHRIPRYKTTLGYRLRRRFEEGRAWTRIHARASGNPPLLRAARIAAVLLLAGVKAVTRFPRHSCWQQALCEEGGMVAFYVGRFVGWCGNVVSARQCRTAG